MFKFNTYLTRPFIALNGVKMGKRVRLIGYPFIFRFPDAEIEIGDDCLFRSSFWSNLLGLYQRTIIIAKRKGKIKIGDDVGISGTTVYAWDHIEIGSHTRIGANCKLIDTDMHAIDMAERNADNFDAVKTAPIKIGESCFIGCNCLILKGVTIGDGAVIGAGSVVTSDVPPFTVAAGNPARVIKIIENGENKK